MMWFSFGSVKGSVKYQTWGKRKRWVLGLSRGYNRIFIGGTDAEAPILWPPDAKSQLNGKDPDAGKDWTLEEKGRQWRTGKPGVLQPVGSQRIGHNRGTEQQKRGNRSWEGAGLMHVSTARSLALLELGYNT